MHITATCPRCHSQYQVESELRGKRMRCLNTICRAVFEIGEEGAAAEPAAPVAPPALPAPPPPAPPPLTPPSPEARPVPPSWREGPPVRQRAEAPAPRPAAPSPAASRPAETPEVPDDFPVDAPAVAVAAAPNEAAPAPAPGTWEAPPVRQPACAAAVSAPAIAPEVAPHRARRRSLTIIMTMLALLVAGIGFGLWHIGVRQAELEEERFAQALSRYEAQDYAEAVALLRGLQQDYPASADLPRYRFLAELSDVRLAVATPHEDAGSLLHAWERTRQFLAMHQNDPLLEERHADARQMLHRLAADLLAEAERDGDKAYLTLAQRAWSEASKYQTPGAVAATTAERKFQEDVRRIDHALARRAERRSLSELLETWSGAASAARLRQARRLVEAAKLQDEPEFKALLDQLVAAHRDQVIYTPVAEPEKAPKPEKPKDDDALLADALVNIAVTPAEGKVEPAPASGIVLALARGVLYAFDAAGGDFRWARRVGVDITELPLRIAAADGKLEHVLVLSTDRKTLAAVETAGGAALWRHQLSDPCLAQPLLVRGRLLAPTLGGRIEDIDPNSGRLQGYWQLDQPLRCGGAHLPGTSLAYFAGESDCVYALDVESKRCTGILYTGATAGEVLAPPVVWPEERLDAPASQGDGPRGWLVLIRAEQTGGTRLDSWPLPWPQPHQAPVSPSQMVAGKSWFPAWHTRGRLALATDAGQLGLFGIRLPGNRDPLLFPWLKEHPRMERQGSGGRALVVYAEAGDFWVLMHGHLQRWQSSYSAKNGPELTPSWGTPPQLGTPLHAAQTVTAPGRKTTLFIATQALDGPACRLSAVDAASGRIFWRRQLGVAPSAPAVVWEKRVLLPEADGLVALAPGSLEGKQSWRAAGTRIGNPSPATGRLFVERGAKALELTWSDKALAWRHLADGKPEPEQTTPLPAAPAGVPALGGDYAVVALTSGVVARVAPGGESVSGPDWRAPGAEESSAGHVVSVGADLFAVTDGSRGVQLVHWPAAKMWEKKAASALAHRILFAPAVLTRAEAGKLRLAIADAADGVTLLEGDNLQVGRRWRLEGAITAAPVALGRGIAVILDKRRLVWLDPEQPTPRWEYACGADLIGSPQLIDGRVIVADAGGTLTALDPANGKASGAGFRLRPHVAPASAPLALDDARLLLPLTDGTLAVLSRFW